MIRHLFIYFLELTILSFFPLLLTSSHRMMNSAIKMVTAFGALRWWSAPSTTGMHKKNGSVSFCFDSDSHYLLFHQEEGSSFKLELPHISSWEKPTSKKFSKASCSIRSVLVSFKGDGIQRIQLSFAIETDANGVVKDHGKLLLLAMEKAFKGEDDW
jgi:hypothetical protein